MSWLRLIKEAAIDAVEASNPMQVRYATVTQVSPVAVIVEQRLSLSSEFLVLTERVIEKKIMVHGEEYIVRDGLKVGDRVALLKVQGGSQYIILDKVVPLS